MLINGYKLITELKSDNSGFAKWGFAEKDGIQVFIKQFLTPVYPIDKTVLSDEQINAKINICEQFEKEKKAFYEKLSQCTTGNIITVFDFFRFESKYYVITEKVETKSLTPKEIANLSTEKKILIIKTILYNIGVLHKNGIVHADIKPNNVMIKETVKGFYTAKLIDFDSGFLENSVSIQTNTEGDLVYFSPEAYMVMAGNENAQWKLTHKMDIFALGIMFHQYLTGNIPEFDKSEYDYIFEAVLDGDEILLDKTLNNDLRAIIRSMLNANPDDRPEASQIFKMLSDEKHEANEQTTEMKTSSALKITMRKHEKEVVNSTNSFLKPAGDL